MIPPYGITHLEALGTTFKLFNTYYGLFLRASPALLELVSASSFPELR